MNDIIKFNDDCRVDLLHVPTDPLQKLAMLAWIRTQKKALKAVIKEFKNLEDNLLSNIDKTALPFVLPPEEQLRLGE